MRYYNDNLDNGYDNGHNKRYIRQLITSVLYSNQTYYIIYTPSQGPGGYKPQYTHII